jgi:EAL domain-containing protein (putative c-di-GMP-specific phosphodiesterase class I)/AmiR/NasT family two-component response regulator
MHASKEFAHLRVLLVDDQEHVRRFERSVLAMLGVTDIVEAANGREAVAEVSQPGGWFDLILCDLRMPDWDGVETMRAFAALGVQSGVAIVSGEDERLIDTSALLAHAHGLRLLGTVQKPITVPKLEPILAKLRTRMTPSRGLSVVLAPESDIGNAFERQELCLMYQPKISVKTGELSGVEALVRWVHPEFGMFPPSAFVPLMEGSPQYSAMLTEFTLRDAIACVGRAAKAGRELHAAINLSRRAFDRLDLPEWLEQVCRDHAVPTAQITLELTETAVAHDAVRLLDVATRLRLKGFALSIDDFGTGESGLSQLKRLPFTEIKIDREFVDGCSKSTTQRSVVEASLALARSLSMTAVAEGVQYRNDWDVLASMGCDIVQGYYVSMPMPESQLYEWQKRMTPFQGATGD